MTLGIVLLIIASVFGIAAIILMLVALFRLNKEDGINFYLASAICYAIAMVFFLVGQLLS